MNNRHKILSFIFVLLVCNMGNSKTIDSPYEVGTWPGFRLGAVSYTFDDNCPNQFEIAIPMFEEFGFKMTLFTITNWAKDRWDSLQKASLMGHEIASHTVTHPRLNQMTIEQQTKELKDSQDVINEKIKDKKCLTIAYPYCVTGDISLCEKYYIAARGCQGFIEKSTPGNFMNISSIVCGNLGSLKTTENFTKKFEDTAASKGWCVLLFHGIDNDGGYSPVPSPILRETLEYLKTNKDKYWVETFLNVVRYIKERDDVSVKESSKKDESITIQVTDTLDNAIYNYPVTIRRPLPQGWQSAKVSQNNKAIEASIVETNSVKYVMFDVVPDGGDVVLTKASF
jgi:hypothetical protein